MRSYSAQELTRTTFCDVPACPDDAEPGTRRCRPHRGVAITPAPVLRPRAAGPMRVERAKPGQWTRTTILTAFYRWRSHYGSPPMSDDWVSGVSPTYPTLKTVRVVFGSWAEMVVAAGYERPQRGSSRRPVAACDVDRLERELLEQLEREAA